MTVTVDGVSGSVLVADPKAGKTQKQAEGSGVRPGQGRDAQEQIGKTDRGTTGRVS